MMRAPRLLPSISALGVLILLAVPALAQVDASVSVNEERFKGTHPNGSLLLYSPDPVRLGSSISHWDTSASPNLLMEPFATGDLRFLDLDITPGLMNDVFWESGTSNINIFSFDPPDTGFSDPTPFSGAPGNPATTLGEARQNLFNAVLGTWANTLSSSVDIDVVVVWTDLFCDSESGATLGAAGTTFIISLEGNGLSGPTMFHAALAESLVGSDLTGTPDPDEGGGDVIVFMNAALDNECLGEGTGWYYGLDGDVPAGRFDAAGVLLHELAHGVGFSNFTNESTGEQAGDLPGIYDVFTFDNTMSKYWHEMTPAERQRSAANVAQVTWEGEAANATAATKLTAGVPELKINSPVQVAGTYNIAPAQFGPAIVGSGIAGEVVCMKDAEADVTLLNGCTAPTNPGELAGKIALVDRGGCTFTTKVANAQAAGAVGVIVVNNAGNGVFAMGGSDDTIRIPAVMVGRADGNRIRQAACPGEAAYFDDRFQVTAQWNAGEETKSASAVMLTKKSGYFWFFDDENIEVTVKVLDACSEPGFNNYWFFASGMTDVEVNLTVVDTAKGESRTYTNPMGTPFPPILDTAAFDTCP